MKRFITKDLLKKTIEESTKEMLETFVEQEYDFDELHGQITLWASEIVRATLITQDKEALEDAMIQLGFLLFVAEACGAA